MPYAHPTPTLPMPLPWGKGTNVPFSRGASHNWLAAIPALPGNIGLGCQFPCLQDAVWPYLLFLPSSLPLFIYPNQLPCLDNYGSGHKVLLWLNTHIFVCKQWIPPLDEKVVHCYLNPETITQSVKGNIILVKQVCACSCAWAYATESGRRWTDHASQQHWQRTSTLTYPLLVPN